MEFFTPENLGNNGFTKLYNTTQFDCPICQMVCHKPEELEIHLKNNHEDLAVVEILSSGDEVEDECVEPLANRPTPESILADSVQNTNTHPNVTCKRKKKKKKNNCNEEKNFVVKSAEKAYKGPCVGSKTNTCNESSSCGDNDKLFKPGIVNVESANLPRDCSPNEVITKECSNSCSESQNTDSGVCKSKDQQILDSAKLGNVQNIKMGTLDDKLKSKVRQSRYQKLDGCNSSLMSKTQPLFIDMPLNSIEDKKEIEFSDLMSPNRYEFMTRSNFGEVDIDSDKKISKPEECIVRKTLFSEIKGSSQTGNEVNVEASKASNCGSLSKCNIYDVISVKQANTQNIKMGTHDKLKSKVRQSKNQIKLDNCNSSLMSKTHPPFIDMPLNSIEDKKEIELIDLMSKTQPPFIDMPLNSTEDKKEIELSDLMSPGRYEFMTKSIFGEVDNDLDTKISNPEECIVRKTLFREIKGSSQIGNTVNVEASKASNCGSLSKCTDVINDTKNIVNDGISHSESEFVTKKEKTNRDSGDAKVVKNLSLDKHNLDGLRKLHEDDFEIFGSPVDERQSVDTIEKKCEKPNNISKGALFNEGSKYLMESKEDVLLGEGLDSSKKNSVCLSDEKSEKEKRCVSKHSVFQKKFNADDEDNEMVIIDQNSLLVREGNVDPKVVYNLNLENQTADTVGNLHNNLNPEKQTADTVENLCTNLNPKTKIVGSVENLCKKVYPKDKIVNAFEHLHKNLNPENEMADAVENLHKNLNPENEMADAVENLHKNLNPENDSAGAVENLHDNMIPEKQIADADKNLHKIGVEAVKVQTVEEHIGVKLENIMKNTLLYKECHYNGALHKSAGYIEERNGQRLIGTNSCGTVDVFISDKTSVKEEHSGSCNLTNLNRLKDDFENAQRNDDNHKMFLIDQNNIEVLKQKGVNIEDGEGNFLDKPIASRVGNLHGNSADVEVNNENQALCRENLSHVNFVNVVVDEGNRILDQQNRNHVRNVKRKFVNVEVDENLVFGKQIPNHVGNMNEDGVDEVDDEEILILGKQKPRSARNLGENSVVTEDNKEIMIFAKQNNNHVRNLNENSVFIENAEENPIPDRPKQIPNHVVNLNDEDLSSDEEVADKFESIFRNAEINSRDLCDKDSSSEDEGEGLFDRGSLKEKGRLLSVEITDPEEFLGSSHFTNLHMKKIKSGLKDRGNKIIIANVPSYQGWVDVNRKKVDLTANSLSKDMNKNKKVKTKTTSGDKSNPSSMRTTRTYDSKACDYHIKSEPSASYIPYNSEYATHGKGSLDDEDSMEDWSNTNTYELNKWVKSEDVCNRSFDGDTDHRIKSNFHLEGWDSIKKNDLGNKTSEMCDHEGEDYTLESYTETGATVNSSHFLENVSADEDSDNGFHLKIEDVFCLKDREVFDKDMTLLNFDDEALSESSEIVSPIPNLEFKEADSHTSNLESNDLKMCDNLKMPNHELTNSQEMSNRNTDEIHGLTSETVLESVSVNTIPSLKGPKDDENCSAPTKILEMMKLNGLTALGNYNTGAKNSLFKCPKCRKIHHGNSVFNHKCTSLASTSKPYKCSQCSFACCVKEDLVFHFRRCFRKRRIKDKMTKQSTNTQKSSCPLCSEEFNSRFRFVHHLFRVHANVVKSKAFRSEILSAFCKSEQDIATNSKPVENLSGDFDDVAHSWSSISQDPKLNLAFVPKKPNVQAVEKEFENSEEACVETNKKKFKDLKESSVGRDKEKSKNKLFSCILCNTNFQSLYRLSIHGLRKHGEFYPREIPGRILENSVSETSALAKSVSGPYTCLKCSHSFMSPDLLRQHKKMHHKKYSQCVFCKMNLSKHEFKSHIVKCIQRLCTKRSLETFHDESKVQSARYVPTEISATQKTLFKCPVCLQSFSRKEIFFDHLCTHIPFRPYQCQWCSKEFMRKTALTEHTDICKNKEAKFKRLDTESSCTNESCVELPSPTLNSTGMERIPIRGEVSVMSNHTKLSDENAVMPENNLQDKKLTANQVCRCSSCRKIFASKKEIFYHSCTLRSDTHGPNRQTNYSNGPPNYIKHCNLCFEPFKNAGDLENHLNSFHGTLKCLYCSGRFKNRIDLKYHTLKCRSYSYSSTLSEDNAGNDQVPSNSSHRVMGYSNNCVRDEESLKEFQNKKSDGFTVNKSSENKFFRCSVCDRHFRSYYHLYNHKSSMHGNNSNSTEEKLPAPPPISSISEYKQKKVRFQEAKEKQSICTSCGETFFSVSLLKLHSKSCSQIKEIKKHQATKFHQNAHLVPSHVTKSSSQSLREDENVKVLRKWRKNKEQIAFMQSIDSDCESDGESAQDFEGFEKPFMCVYCKTEFIDRFSFQLHLTKHHGKSENGRLDEIFELKVQLKRLNIHHRAKGCNVQSDRCRKRKRETCRSPCQLNDKALNGSTDVGQKVSYDEKTTSCNEKQRAFPVRKMLDKKTTTLSSEKHGNTLPIISKLSVDGKATTRSSRKGGSKKQSETFPVIQKLLVDDKATTRSSEKQSKSFPVIENAKQSSCSEKQKGIEIYDFTDDDAEEELHNRRKRKKAKKKNYKGSNLSKVYSDLKNGNKSSIRIYDFVDDHELQNSGRSLVKRKKRYFRKRFLKAQLEMNIKTSMGPSIAYSCDVCQKTVRNKEELKSHTCSKSRKDNDDWLPKGSAKSLEFKCKKCKQVFSSPVEVQNHLKCSHSVIFKCLICDVKFIYSGSFAKHFKNHHPRSPMILNRSYVKLIK